MVAAAAPPPPFEYLSDHFGLAATFCASDELSWKDEYTDGNEGAEAFSLLGAEGAVGEVKEKEKEQGAKEAPGEVEKSKQERTRQKQKEMPPLLPEVFRASRRHFATNPCLGRRQ